MNIVDILELIGMVILFLVISFLGMGFFAWIVFLIRDLDNATQEEIDRQERMRQYILWAVEHGEPQERLLAMQYYQQLKQTQALGGLLFLNLFMN